MIYSSLLFIYGFLPVSLLFYYVTPKKHRDKVLLLLSILFCGLLSLWYLGLMIVYTAVNYTACRVIGKGRERPAAAIPFAAAMIFDLAVILVFRTKYFAGSLSAIGIPEKFFPLGISFLTLSALGTLIDVYTGRLTADRDIVRFSLYFMFFPKLIMGPVLRYGSFKKALENRREGLNEIGIGFTIFVKGLTKKIIAADNLYVLYKAANTVDVREMSAMTAWLGVTAYILCLYFTLSGFSDMGTGISYFFGLRLPQCFNYPMFSTKIRYFAARWHIQVLHWFRRYVTRPLSGASRNRLFRRVMFTAAWGTFGFWYRFDLNGIIWGVLIGIFLLAENRLARVRLLGITGTLYTFIVTALCAVFLAGDSVSHSFRYILAMLGGNNVFADSLAFYLLRSYIVILLIGMYASTDLFRNMLMRSGRTRFRAVFTAVSPAIVLVFLIICTILLSYSGSSGMILLKL